LGFICHSLSDKDFSFAKNSTTKIRKLFKMQAILEKINRFFLLFGGGSTSVGLFMQAEACKHNGTEAGASAQRLSWSLSPTLGPTLSVWIASGKPSQ
jgi:hypothetical protein